MKKLLPALILAPLGLGVGLAGGQALRPPEPETEAEAGAEAGAEIEAEAPPPDLSGAEYVKLDRQFVVPVVTSDKVESMIVISLAIEMSSGGSDIVFKHEPRLRDEFLRVLFIHAQSGGFSGVFTQPHLLDDLRASLESAARMVLGSGARSVLLTNIVRKDL